MEFTLNSRLTLIPTLYIMSSISTVLQSKKQTNKKHTHKNVTNPKTEN